MEMDLFRRLRAKTILELRPMGQGKMPALSPPIAAIGAGMEKVDFMMMQRADVLVISRENTIDLRVN
jgi:hypothetical protein